MTETQIRESQRLTLRRLLMLSGNNAKSETLADRFAAVKEKYWNEETQKYDITDADAVIEAIVPERGSEH